VGHAYVERRLLRLGARPLRAGANPARWLADALDDVHAVRLRHRGCLRYAMLTSRSARRHVRLRLPTVEGGRPTVAVATVNDLASRGINGPDYPKQVDTDR